MVALQSGFKEEVLISLNLTHHLTGQAGSDALNHMLLISLF